MDMNSLFRRSSRIVTLCCLVLLAGLSLTACDPTTSTTEPTTLPTTQMTLGGQSYVMEKATTGDEQERGLMYRDSLPDGHGMIFIFDNDSTTPFWNHDVRFPIDVIFIDKQAKILSIQQLQPYDDTNTKPVPSYHWVIELNKGTAASLGMKEGDTVTIPADAQ